MTVQVIIYHSISSQLGGEIAATFFHDLAFFSAFFSDFFRVGN
jgi:hypothetical protein